MNTPPSLTNVCALFHASVQIAMRTNHHSVCDDLAKHAQSQCTRSARSRLSSLPVTLSARESLFVVGIKLPLRKIDTVLSLPLSLSLSLPLPLSRARALSLSDTVEGLSARAALGCLDDIIYIHRLWRWVRYEPPQRPAGNPGQPPVGKRPPG